MSGIPGRSRPFAAGAPKEGDWGFVALYHRALDELDRENTLSIVPTVNL